MLKVDLSLPSQVKFIYKLEHPKQSFRKYKKWFAENYLNGFFTIFYNFKKIGYIKVWENRLSIVMLPDFLDKKDDAIEFLLDKYGYRDLELKS